jgi:type VI secretion system secreted protein Hcp
MATIFLKWPGFSGSATAEGTDDKYGGGWIDASSLSFNVERTIKQGSSNATNREAAHPVISQFTVGKTVDKASPKLFEQSVIGKPQEVKIHLCSPAPDGKMRKYAAYTLVNCIISQYKITGEADGAPKEELQLAWTKINFEFLMFMADNKSPKPGSPIKFGYDLAKNVIT